MKKLALSIAAVPLVSMGLVAVPGAILSTASADACDHTNHREISRSFTAISARINGEDSYYNRSKDPIDYTLTFGKSETNSVTKHWKVGASASGGWGPFKVEISGEYGEDYVKAATTNVNKALTMHVRPGYTGWVRAVFYQRYINAAVYTYRWHADEKRCVKQYVSQGRWGGPKIQYVPVTVKGHRYPN